MKIRDVLYVPFTPAVAMSVVDREVLTIHTSIPLTDMQSAALVEHIKAMIPTTGDLSTEDFDVVRRAGQLFINAMYG